MQKMQHILGPSKKISSSHIYLHSFLKQFNIIVERGGLVVVHIDSQ